MQRTHENLINQIRNEWFGEHVVNLREEPGLTLIRWGKPGESFYRMKLILCGNNVFISGDVGDAVYTLTCEATLKNMRGFDLSYFTKKLTAYSEDRWDFDPALAKKQVRDYFNENAGYPKSESQKKLERELVSIVDDSSSIAHYHQHLFSLHESSDFAIEPDTLDDVHHFGRTIPHRLIGYWVALQMIAEQQDAKNTANHLA